MAFVYLNRVSASVNAHKMNNVVHRIMYNLFVEKKNKVGSGILFGWTNT